MNYVLISTAIILPISYMSSRLLLQNTNDPVSPPFNTMCFHTQLTPFTAEHYIRLVGQYDFTECQDTTHVGETCHFSRFDSNDIELQMLLSSDGKQLVPYLVKNATSNKTEIHCSNDPNWPLSPNYPAHNCETNALDAEFTCCGDIETTDSQALKQAQLTEGSCSDFCNFDLSGDSGQCINEGRNARLKCCGTDRRRYEVLFRNSETCSGRIPSELTEIYYPLVDPICCVDINKQNCPSEVYNIKNYWNI